MTLRGFCGECGEPFSALVHPLRVAVSGRGEGPGLFDLLALLGRERCVARLRKVAAALASGEFARSLDQP